MVQINLNMDREDRENFMQLNSLVFEGNELLLSGNILEAERIYTKISDIYKALPQPLKIKAFGHARDLKSKINKHMKSPRSNEIKSTYFSLFDGRVIKDLYHLVYALDTMDDLQWQCYVNHVKNDLYEWIKYTLQDHELADMLAGITDKEEIKLIVLRHLLMKNFDL
jgi:hypothetical protein